MDKPRKERITIRINGKEKQLLTEQELNEEIAAAKEDNLQEVQPIIIEEPQVEQAIDELVIDERSVNKIIDFEEQRNKRILSKDSRDSQVTPTNFEKTNILLTKKKKSRNPLLPRRKALNSPLKRIVISLLLAISIGTGLGYVVLSLFSDLASDQEKNTNHNINNNEQAIQSQATNSHSKSNEAITEVNTQQQVTPIDRTAKPNPAPAVANTEIVPMTIEVVQGGAFSTVDSANEYATKLRQNGEAAVIAAETNPILMFIGIALNRSDLSVIDNYYKNKGQDVYIKTIDINGLDSSKLDQQLASYSATGQALFQSLVNLSTEVLNTKKIDDTTWIEIEQLFTEWNKIKATNVPPTLAQFSNSLLVSYQELAKFRTTNNDKQLWNAQQALLEGLLSYQKWIHDSSKL